MVNEQYGDLYHVFYSNPTQYTQARAEENLVWTVKTDDFFPYADCAHCYWGGYFTSRPTLKRLERQSSSYLQALKQLSVHIPSLPLPSYTVEANDQDISSSSSGANAISHSPLFSLTAAVGLVNHHDAVTGTSKQHVAYDYIRILSAALTLAERTVGEVISRALLPSSTVDTNTNIMLPTLKACRMMNESICDVTQQLTVGSQVIVVAYNSLPRSASQLITVILGSIVSDSNTKVYVLSQNSDGSVEYLYSEIVPPCQLATGTNALCTEVYTLFFQAEDIPALSTRQYLVQLRSAPSSEKGDEETGHLIPISAKLLVEEEWSESLGNLIIKNDEVELVFNSSTGNLHQVSRMFGNDEGDRMTTRVNQEFAYYIGYGRGSGELSPNLDLRDPHIQNLVPAADIADPDVSTQPSGAYIFRPAEQHNKQSERCAKSVMGPDEVAVVSVVRGRLVKEVRQIFKSWITQIVRLSVNSATADLEWTVGPIPVSDGRGREIVSRFSTDIRSDESFYTDANGREFQLRVRDSRQSWNLVRILWNVFIIISICYLIT
jgi:hypothetical protein